MNLIEAASNGRKNGRKYRICVVAATMGMLIWQTPFSTGFVVRDLWRPAKLMPAVIIGKNGKASIRLLSLQLKLEDEVSASNPETKATSSPIPVDRSSNDNSTPSSTSFTEFASNRTPILADLLSSDNNGQSSSSSTPGLREENEDSSQPTLWQERSSEWTVVGLSTFALVGILGDLLSNYEWVQTLRYFWPLSLGVYYGLLLNTANDRDSALRRDTIEAFGPSSAFSPNTTSDEGEIKDLLLQMGYVFGGFGLFVGGLADALLPVWMTGPNWITNAGLAPDCAILLLVLSIGDQYNLFGNNREYEPSQHTQQSFSSSRGSVTTTGMATLLVRITLWAELYKLGEGSLDEIFTNFQTLFSGSI